MTPAKITSTARPAIESGSSSRSVSRVRSTQKFPSRSVCVRVNPRIERRPHGDADRGGQEVLHRQPDGCTV